jgi:histidinol-phosphate aminotransferase
MKPFDDLICRHVQSMHGYVPGEQPRIPGLVKLNTNENPYPPSPKVMQALAEIGESQVRMYPDPVSLTLRQRIADLHGCQVDQVFAANGSDEVLALCTRAFVEDGGVIASFDPSYSLYPILSDIRPARFETVPLTPDYEWNMPANFHASLFYLTNPNAPTSLQFPKEKIRSFCASFAGVVVIDEAYADFAPWNCMDLIHEFPNVLVSRSLSKSYSLAGARAGYVVGSAPLIAAMFTIKDSYNVNAVTQAMALAAIDDQAHMKANVAKILATRVRIANEMKTRGYTVYESATNFLWARPPAGQTAETVFRHLREHKVLIRYFPGEKTGDCIRVTIGTDEQMDAFLNALPA